MDQTSNQMKKIAVTGGKGGTGKSTVAILLANKYRAQNQKIILCDLDVECPNDYLLLGEKLKKVALSVFAQFPRLDKKKCQKCGLCVKNCYNHTIFQIPQQYPIFLRDLCSGCGACWHICPYEAIQQTKEKIGKIYLNKINDNFYLVTGSAQPGVGKTGLVVTDYVVAKTKEFVSELAQQFKPDKIIFDTAAGTHCPIITGIMNSDFAYAVAEPTPMGVHDLGLILDLCQKLKVPAKIILNQANLGEKQATQNIAKNFKTSTEIEIPYSKQIVEAYSTGKLIKINFLK